MIHIIEWYWMNHWDYHVWPSLSNHQFTWIPWIFWGSPGVPWWQPGSFGVFGSKTFELTTTETPPWTANLERPKIPREPHLWSSQKSNWQLSASLRYLTYLNDFECLKIFFVQCRCQSEAPTGYPGLLFFPSFSRFRIAALREAASRASRLSHHDDQHIDHRHVVCGETQLRAIVVLGWGIQCWWQDVCLGSTMADGWWLMLISSVSHLHISYQSWHFGVSPIFTHTV